MKEIKLYYKKIRFILEKPYRKLDICEITRVKKKD